MLVLGPFKDHNLYFYVLICPLDHTAFAVRGKVIVTQADRPKSVRNRCIIKLFVSSFELSFDIYISWWFFCQKTRSLATSIATPLATSTSY